MHVVSLSACWTYQSYLVKIGESVALSSWLVELVCAGGAYFLSLVLKLLWKSYGVPRGAQFSYAGADSDDSIFLLFVLGCCFRSALLRPALCLLFLWEFSFCSSLIFIVRCLYYYCTTEILVDGHLCGTSFPVKVH